MIVYAVIFDPNGCDRLKDIYMTREHAERRARELEEEDWLYPCGVIEWEVKE